MLIPIRRLSEEHQIISGPIPMGAFTDDIQKSFWFILTLSVESEHPYQVSHPILLWVSYVEGTKPVLPACLALSQRRGL